MTARCGRDPGALYRELAEGHSARRSPIAVEAPATAQQKKQLAALAPQRITASELAGEPITAFSTARPATAPPSAASR